MLRRTMTAAIIFFFAVSLFAQQQSTKHPPSLTVRELGYGAVPLDGAWKFHTGDDAQWSSPSFDDSGWQPIQTDSSWGSQGNPGYTGFAWYRKHLQIDTVAGAKSDYALLMPPVDDAYEVYWNGVLIGQYGQVPPHASWYYTSLYRTFAVPSVSSGTIAIRVWKSRLLFVDSSALGGLTAPPILGDADTIAAQMAGINAESTQQFLYDYTLIILYGFVTAISLLLWTRNRKIKLFLWLAVFTATPVLLSILQGLFPIPISISYAWGRGLNQPIYALNHISLWFLLLWLLRLDGNHRLVRWTQVLAICTLVAGVLDGGLAFFWSNAGVRMQDFDAVLTMIILTVEFFPFVIIVVGVRQELEASRWWVALSALVSKIIGIVADASAAGQRFTHWTLYEMADAPLFVLAGVPFRISRISAIVLFLSILYAVYRYTTEQQARQSLLEREMHSAQEIQRVLIPETLPSLEGFAVTSAYQPALEVGGDFFQIIREQEGSTIVALGDVSGKGLKAAMNVSLIVGVLRSLSDGSFSPVEILERLNLCLCGRMQGGFVTAIILRLHGNGSITLANAGHLPPFLNQQELTIEGSLPLGLLPSAEYEKVQLQLNLGDQLSLYTDGILEARNASGELYGFDRLHTLFAARPSAQQASDAAIAFGQEDDITVLTLTRLEAGEESTTSLLAPSLEQNFGEK